jgi:hypothetical protein
MQITREQQKLAYIRLCSAEQFFSAAKLLSTPDLIKAQIKLPRLHILCHGIEITMKAALTLEGLTEKELQHEYGHNLSELWDASRNANFRAVIAHSCPIVWAAAKSSPQWKGTVVEDYPPDEFEKGLHALSIQHDRTNNFALRYPTTPQLDGWSPYFLIDLFLFVVGWYLRPQDAEQMDGYPSIPTFGADVRR